MSVLNLLTVEGSGFMVEAEYFTVMVEEGFDTEVLDLDTKVWFEDEKVFIRFRTPEFPLGDDTLSRMSAVWPSFAFTLESTSGNGTASQRRISSRLPSAN